MMKKKMKMKMKMKTKMKFKNLQNQQVIDDQLEEELEKMRMEIHYET